MKNLQNNNVILCNGSCVLRGHNNICSRYNCECKLDCELYLKIINDVKELLDSEAKKDTMAVHPKERIIEAIVNGDVIIAKNNKEEVIGFIYLIHWKNHIEIAGLVVKECFRKHKLGGKLFKDIFTLAQYKYPEKKIIFFANNVSQKFGQKHGFLAMPELIVNPEFQSLCKDCTKEYKKPQDCRCRVMIFDEQNKFLGK